MLGGSAGHVRDDGGDRAVLRFVVAVVGAAAAIRHHRPATVQSQTARDDAVASLMDAEGRVAIELVSLMVHRPCALSRRLASLAPEQAAEAPGPTRTLLRRAQPRAGADDDVADRDAIALSRTTSSSPRASAWAMSASSSNRSVKVAASIWSSRAARSARVSCDNALALASSSAGNAPPPG